MIGILFILVLLITILSYFYWLQTCSRKAKLLNKFPLVSSITPVLGNVDILSTDQEILFTQLRKYSAKFKETFAGWGGIVGTLHIVTPEDAEVILTNVNLIEKGFLYTILETWLDTGLLTSTGTKWHQRRKLLTPAFHYNILKMYIQVFGQQSEKLIQKLRENCKENETNIIPIITETTLATICEAAIGIKLDRNDKKQKGYFDSLYNLAPIIIKIALSPWLYPDYKLFYFSPTHWKYTSIVKNLHKFSRHVIKKRQETFEDSDVADLELADKKSKKCLAMLDLLIYAQRQTGEIDDEGIREEVDTFVFEGHDTTSVGVCFALLLLAHHEDVQVKLPIAWTINVVVATIRKNFVFTKQKIIEELDEIFNGSDRHATYDDLQNMKYLERCLKECLRIYPSVPLIARKIREDVQLTHHLAPAGTEVFIHIYNIHRDPRYFPDPEKFDPDRFLPENSKGRHPFSYIPFSAGPRNCIGQKFAMLELKSIVSSILRNFTMEPVDSPQDLVFVVDLVLRVKDHIRIKFKPRF